MKPNQDFRFRHFFQLFQALSQYSSIIILLLPLCSHYMAGQIFFFSSKSCIEQVFECPIPARILQAGPQCYIRQNDLQPKDGSLFCVCLMNTQGPEVSQGLIREEMPRALTLCKCQSEVPDISPNPQVVSPRTRPPQHKADASTHSPAGALFKGFPLKSRARSGRPSF